MPVAGLQRAWVAAGNIVQMVERISQNPYSVSPPRTVRLRDAVDTLAPGAAEGFLRDLAFPA